MPLFKKNPEDNDSVKADSSEAAQSADEGELIAVISAAVAAYLGSISSVSESGTIVRSLRVGEPSSPWVQYSRIKNVQ